MSEHFLMLLGSTLIGVITGALLGNVIFKSIIGFCRKRAGPIDHYELTRKLYAEHVRNNYRTLKKSTKST